MAGKPSSIMFGSPAPHQYAPDTVPFIEISDFAADEAPRLRSVLLPDLEAPGAAALHQALRSSDDQVVVRVATPARLQRFAQQLAAGHCMPVGDAAFVSRCMELAGIPRPAWKCYPKALHSHMQHLPRRTTVSAALRWPKPVFVRPAASPGFRGFVLHEEPEQHRPADRVHLDALLSMHRSERVWVAAPLPIRSNWRYYVLNGELVGYQCIRGKADIEPDFNEVSAIIAAVPLDLVYILEMAVLKSGATTLLRTRDAWGVEYPAPGSPTAPSPLDFLRLLWARWADIMQRVHAKPRGQLAA